LARVLVFRPRFDLPTIYGNAWLGRIAEEARALGHTVLDLSENDATKDRFLEALTDFRPDLIFAMGHGSPELFSGQNREIVFRACENDDVLIGTQSYWVSCLMGQNLAPSIVDKGGRVAAAYIQEFIWVIHPGYDDRPLEDPYALPFMRAVVDPSIALLAGSTWRDFYNLTVRRFNEGVRAWFDSTDPNAPQIVAALEHDRDSLIVLGEVTLVPAPIPWLFPALPPAVAGVILLLLAPVL